MVNRILRNKKAIGPIDRLLSNLNECNWIQTKGNFRMKSFKKSDISHRCEPGEGPWDTIMVDGHGPHSVPSLQGAAMGYYFRSRYGGAVIVKGAKTKDQFPWLLEQVIIEVKNRGMGFEPKRIFLNGFIRKLPLV